LRGAFHKISRVGSLTGGTKWYLTEDCLLAAKRTMYAVEYRRFYLQDLKSIIVWPSRLWPVRLIIPGVLVAALGASLWQWVNHIAGAIFGSLSLAWVVLELMLGPTAKSRIQTTGGIFDLPLVNRTRRAQKALAKINAAVGAIRGVIEQTTAPTIVSQPAEPTDSIRPESDARATAVAATGANVS
jgi:hypothetical protein